jgi:hypothetical protein
MDANFLGLSFLGILTIYVGYVGFTKPETTIQPITPWGEETGKTHNIQSKNHDASMMTERRRRQAIQQVGRLSKYKLKESRTQFGSTTGAIETFMLSSICPALPCAPECPSDIIYDGGNQANEFCPLLYYDENATALDAGNPNTNACGPPVCPSDVIYDGGNQANEFCPILNDEGNGPALDAGNQNTKTCGN